MFDIIDESLKKNTDLDIGDVLKRLTLDALTLAGFGTQPTKKKKKTRQHGFYTNIKCK